MFVKFAISIRVPNRLRELIRIFHTSCCRGSKSDQEELLRKMKVILRKMAILSDLTEEMIFSTTLKMLLLYITRNSRRKAQLKLLGSVSSDRSSKTVTIKELRSTNLPPENQSSSVEGAGKVGVSKVIYF